VSNALVGTLASVLNSVDPPAITATPARALASDDVLLAHEPPLRRLVHRLLGWPAQSDEVADVVQEVFLAAWQHRSSFRGDAALSTWLMTIALRKARNHARWLAVRRRWFTFCAELPEPAAPATDHDDRLRATHAAMAQLVHRDREVLVLRYLEARPIEAIAALLGVSRNAADARLSRARQRLRALLLPPEDEA